MTDWLRLWHGAPTDPKWRTVARRSGSRPGDVWAIVAVLMDRASQAPDRGSVEGYDCEIIADALGYDPDEVERVIAALIDKGVIVDGRLSREIMKRAGIYPGFRPPAHVWADLRDLVFRRDNFTCAYCGARGVRLECDHVVPASKGGSSALHNLVAACVPCNRSKGARLLENWRPS